MSALHVKNTLIVMSTNFSLVSASGGGVAALSSDGGGGR